MARVMDDVELARVQVIPRYGGHPSPLADPTQLECVKALLLSGERIDNVAREVGYCHVQGFSDAFLARTGERPSAFQKRHGVKPPRLTPLRRTRCLGELGPVPLPDRTGQVPYPTYEQSERRRKASAKARQQRANERARERRREARAKRRAERKAQAKAKGSE